MDDANIPRPNGKTLQKRSFEVARALSRKLGSVPSMVWALIYLMCIPTFAAMYTAFTPGAWYYGTILHEERFRMHQNAFVDELSRDVLDKIAPLLMRTAPRPTRGFSFIPAHDYIKDSAGEMRVGVYSATSNEEETLRFHLRPVGDLDLAKLPESLDPTGFRVIADCEGLAPTERECMALKVQLDLGEKNFFPATDHLIGAMSLVLREQDGISTGRTIDTFFRMLYLSAMTLTTVGYGDIVPLTDFARLVAASEAIIGIVLIGLFLNALSHERDHRKRTSLPIKRTL